MFPNGLLILTQPLRLLEGQLPSLLQSASAVVRNTLYVHLAPGLLSTGSSLSQPLLRPSTEVTRAILQIYGKSANTCSSLDVRVLLGNIHQSTLPLTSQSLSKPLHVIMCDSKIEKQSVADYASEHFNAKDPEIKLLGPEYTADTSEHSEEPDIKTYEHVCLGGTFDRIHSGHKILLSEACIRCNREITVGVTDGPMIESKSLYELIEPTADRISTVKTLIADIRPSVSSDVVPIVDPFGPSIVKADIDCLVVSEETQRGGQAVNKKRSEKGFAETEQHIIELVEDECRSHDEEVKISSSSQRKRLLGSLLKQPNETNRDDVYLIGVAGGIASGKSSICQRLQKLGGFAIDCDKLGHKAYEPGQKAYSALVKEFGEGILDANTKEIDRTKLGAAVFNDETKRQQLNRIVWPAVMELAQEEVTKSVNEGHRLIFLEAALLIEAGWLSWLNELWVTFVPKKEAVKRIVDRNGLSEEAAIKRVTSQLTNAERIPHAHVLLSTLWEPEVTQKQVEKAWSLLSKRLPPNSVL